ncbi:hypothetical protein RSX24_032065, partial [Paenibacillus sp. ES5-4]
QQQRFWSEMEAGKDDLAKKLDEGTGDATKFKFPDDPMRDVSGSGRISNPTEWNDILKDVESQGGKINYTTDSTTMGYGPNGTRGNPGTISIDPDASFSALKHEYQHFLDDKASGWEGWRVKLTDYDEAYRWEVNAYQIEIDMAKELGRNDIVEHLLKNLEKEKSKIYNPWGD